MIMIFWPKSYGNCHILKKYGRDFCKSKMSNFIILGDLEVFDGAESISTMKNTIQTVSLQRFFEKKFAQNTIIRNFFCQKYNHF